jgi:CHU_C Type IX secretion signal domain/SprB repeat
MMRYAFLICFQVGFLYLIQAQPNLNVAVNGTNLSCFNSFDGRFQIQVLSGKTPVEYTWLHLGNGFGGEGTIVALNAVTSMNELGAGTYRFTFTDAMGQSQAIERNLSAPPAIVADLYAEGDLCFGENEGLIRVENVNGGVAPYTFALENGNFSPINQWEGLVPGTYFLYIKDATGCVLKESAILPFGTQFVVEPLPDTSIISGDTLVYQVISSNLIDTIIWLPSIYAQTLDSGLIRLFPVLPTTYQFLAIDNMGCQAIGELFVDVSRNRDVYFPNVFQPSASDPQNRWFSPFTSYGVSYVKSFQIFDQIGREVFGNYKFASNDPQQGWNGTSKGIEMPAGVYLWGAVLRFFDGREEQFWGDVTLLR